MANDNFRFFTLILSTVPTFLGRILLMKVQALVHSFTYGGPTDTPKTVVVIGGSFAGVQAARRLSETLPTGWRVVLLESNSHFNYSFSLPRFSVVAGHERRAFIPYAAIFATALAKRALAVVQGTAVGLTSTAVQYVDAQSGSTSSLPYDAVIIATGSASSPPAKLRAAAEREAACAELQALQSRIRAARNVAVIGGGAVGVELVTDIATFSSTNDKDGKDGKDNKRQVTLVHSREQLMNRFAPRLHEHVLGSLQKLGIHAVLGQRPLVSVAPNATGNASAAPAAGLPGTLRYADGREEEYDCVLVCTGMTPNTSFLRNFGAPGAILTASGEVRVAPTLQVVADSDKNEGGKQQVLANVFAIGDVAATGGPKMARAAFFQSEVALANILSLARNKPATKEYSPVAMEGFIKLTLGKNETVMFMDLGKGDSILKVGSGEPEDMHVKQGWGLVGAKFREEYIA